MGTVGSVEGTRITVGDGVELAAYRSPGWSTDGTVAVLLHGIGMSHLTFERMQPLLAATMSVVSFDLPGFGSTRTPPRPFSVVDHALAVDAALRELGVARRVVVGHSMGAQSAVELAVRRPEEVAGVVLIGPVVDPRRRALLIQAKDLALDMLREPPYANLRALGDYVRGGLPWYLANVTAMFEYLTEDRVRAVRCPVVVMRGERDPVAREPWCRRLASAAAGPAEFVTVPGRAHVIPQTAAAAVAGVVTRVTGNG